MNKNTYIILAVAIEIIIGTFYYTSPTQQWERQSKLYQEQINKLNHAHEKYVYASTLKGGIGSRFHGYNTRLDNVHRFVIN